MFRSRRNLLWVWLVASAVGIHSGHACADASPAAPQTTDELQSAIDAALKDTGAAGVGVVIVSKENVLWSEQFGLADRAAKRAVTAETMFRAGSISKCFVALAVLKLVEEGKLRLDDPVRSLVGDSQFTNRWEATRPLRLVHLLEHTSGFDDIAMCEYAADGPGMSLGEGLAFRPGTRTSRWPPGRFFSYSNAGAPLAAYAVERATGKTFEEYLDEEFLAPLEMKTASFLLTDAVKKNLATGYRSDGVSVSKYKHIIIRPAGALNATPEELAHLVQLWLGRGTFRGARLLSPESIARMETATTTLASANGLRTGYGLANYSTFLEDRRFQGHEGAVTGYSAIARYSPEHGVGYVVMVNAGNFGAAMRIEGPVAAYLTRDWEKRAAAPDAAPAVTLERLAGYYEPCTPRAERVRFLDRLMGRRRFRVEGDHLRGSGIGSSRPALTPVGGDGLFRVNDDPEASLAFVDDGGEQYLVSGNIMSGNYRRLPAWQVWGEAAAVVVCLALMLSAVLFALAWIPRKAFGRLRDVRHLSVRTLPLLAVACLGGAVALLVISAQHANADELLGKRTVWSMGFWLATWLFAAATVAGLVQAIRARRWDVQRTLRWHALAVSLANAAVLAYLAYWGVIGMHTWI